MIQRNKELADILHGMSLIYRYRGPKDRFREIAYRNAARIISGLQNDILENKKEGNLEEIPGIGESIAEKINEYLETGKISKYEKLKKNAPDEIISMMEIRGFGPQSVRKIHERLKINTKSELIRALEDGRIEKLKGFGSKKVENMLNGLKIHKTIESRMLLSDAIIAGEKIVDWLKRLPEVKQVELAGSLRRRKETIGDIDVLVATGEKSRKRVTDHFTSPDFAKEILAKGDTKASIILTRIGKQADLRIVNENEWGAALQYFTGSKEHNIGLRKLAKEKGFKINEYGIFQEKTNKRIAGTSEEDIYHTLGLQWMPPEMRENRGEIELAIKQKIPELVKLSDIRGDLHMHSNWSDGIRTIEEISGFVRKNFNYEYIAMTDHSKTSRIANGMNEREILKYIKEIERVNEKSGSSFVKSGIEVDILNDGKLDISDEILGQLSWVTAAIHSNFNRNNTDRIIRACENKFVSCIAHPTGRQIGIRAAYDIDLDIIIEVAKKTKTALEINAQPDRMDLNDEMAMKVRENGVKLLISTDAHNTDQLSHMNLGVYSARRAWCSKTDILNTMPWEELEKLIQLKRQKLVSLKKAIHV